MDFILSFGFRSGWIAFAENSLSEIEKPSRGFFVFQTISCKMRKINSL
jgi:hypothetical protein